MAREDTLRKIRALLAKESAAGTTAAEVAAAIGLAERLMEREGIERATLELEGSKPAEDVKAFSEPLDAKGQRMDRWRSWLGLCIARSRGCECYVSSTSNGKALKIIGRPSDAEMVRYLYAHCIREIERVSTLACLGEGKTYANNFKLGCVDAIQTAIKNEQRAERDQQRASAVTSTALIVVNNAIARVDAHLKDAQQFGKQHLHLRSTGGSSSRLDPSARAAGREAGACIYGSAKPALGGAQKRIGS